MFDGVLLEADSPSRRVPVRFEGGQVLSLCGPVAQSVRVYVVATLPGRMKLARELRKLIQRAGYACKVERRKEAVHG